MNFLKLIPSHLWVAASSWGARGVSACVQIVSVHYLVSILGEERYSVFILLSALVTWCNLSDFGIGNSILNFIAERRAQGRNYSHLIVSAALLTLILLFTISVSMFFISHAIAGLYLKGYTESAVSNKIQLFYIASIILCTTALAGLIYKIWYAEKIGWLSNVFPAIGSIIGLVGIFLINRFNNDFDNILPVFMVFFVPSTIIAALLLFFRFKKEIHIVTVSNIKLLFVASYKLMKRSRPFFVFAVMGAIVLQTDYIVLSQKGSTSEIILYGVLLKIFNVIYFAYSAVLQSWWPVCTELRVKKQWNELKKTIKISVLLGAIAIVLLTLVVYLFQNYIFAMLGLNGLKTGSFLLFCLFALYFIIRAWCDTYAVLLQTMDNMQPLFFIVPIQALMNVLLQWYLVSYFSLVGILMGSIISFTLTVAIYLPYKFNRLIKN